MTQKKYSVSNPADGSSAIKSHKKSVTLNTKLNEVNHIEPLDLSDRRNVTLNTSQLQRSLSEGERKWWHCLSFCCKNCASEIN